LVSRKGSDSKKLAVSLASSLKDRKTPGKKKKGVEDSGMQIRMKTSSKKRCCIR